MKTHTNHLSKSLTVFLATTLIVFSTAAQDSKSGLFASINSGARLLGATSEAATLAPGLNINGGLQYVFNEYIGVKGRLDYNTYNMSPGMNGAIESTGSSTGVSIEATTDALNLMNVTSKVVGVELHSGFGFTSYRNDNYVLYKQENNLPFNDPAIKGNDDMFHYIVGVTTEYGLNDNFSINLDVSAFTLFKQDHTFDRYNNQQFDGVGAIMTTSIGITYKLTD